MFIEKGYVQSDSIVVFNPQFGKGSELCAGADADIFIDGVLYDFKCGKKQGYDWREVAQLMAYFYLNFFSYAKTKSKIFPDSLKEYNILRVAFYRARSGEVEYFDTDRIEDSKKWKTLNAILDNLVEQPRYWGI